MKRTVTFFCSLSLLFVLAAPAYSQDADTDEKPDKAEAAEKASAEEKEPEIKKLSIGSLAPSLDVEHWVQDGNGDFGVVTDFDENKVYIVEFWATWCGPCIASMPHIAEIQEKYADRDVQVVSISNEDLETVEKFLDREVRGSDDGKTYRDLTSVYCLTTDPDGSSSEEYMRAANRNGIPCAFIVGKKGRIEWIGHPMTMDDALEQIVSDDWDRDAFAEEYIAKQEAQEVLMKLSRFMRSKQIDKGVELLDDYIENGKLESERKRFKQIKFQVLASSEDYADAAADYAIELLEDEHDASSANNLAWNIYLIANAGRYEDERVTRAAMKLARSKVKDAEETKPYLLDTVAHLQHLLGDSDKALATQRRAVKAAGPERSARLMGFLKELEELQGSKKKKDADVDESKDDSEEKDAADDKDKE